MKINLVNYLVCPVCRKNVTLKISNKTNDEILEGIITCSKNHKFAITDGIPRFVVDTSKDFVVTEDAFSSKWRRFNKQYHNKTWFDSEKKWFLDRYGWKTISKFNGFLNSKNTILDAGTGIGNSAKLLSANPNSQVFAIDASESVDFAYKKFGHIKNIHFLQADLRQLPFRRNYFDYINSDQVLHHTKNTETSFKYLTKFLTKGGHFSAYVYAKKAPIREFADNFIRATTTKMSEKECIEFSKDITHLGRSLANIKKKIVIQRDIPILKIKKGTYDLQRFVHWFFMKCYWAEDGDFDRSVGNNFDWYFPKLAFRHTPEEVKQWCKDSKLKIVNFQQIFSGISVLGQKHNN